MGTKVQIEHWVALGTFLLGFCVWLTYSIANNVFWFNSPYDFPLVKIPTMLIGDAIFLPWLNYRITQLVKLQIGENTWQPYAKILLVTGVLAFIVSLGINAYSHYTWSHDPYIGAVDAPYGRLSFAGWWHFGFSTIQMAVIFLLFADWFVVLKAKKPHFSPTR